MRKAAEVVVSAADPMETATETEMAAATVGMVASMPTVVVKAVAARAIGEAVLAASTEMAVLMAKPVLELGDQDAAIWARMAMVLAAVPAVVQATVTVPAAAAPAMVTAAMGVS